MTMLLALVPGWGRALALVALAAGLMGFGAYQMRKHDNVRYEALQTKYINFKTTTASLGKAAEVAAKAQELSDKNRKEKADVENKTTMASLSADNKRLRDERARGRFVPSPSPSSSRPAVACYDRDELERTLQQFDEETSGLLAEGDAAIVDLNTARRWAQSP